MLMIIIFTCQKFLRFVKYVTKYWVYYKLSMARLKRTYEYYGSRETITPPFVTPDLATVYYTPTGHRVIFWLVFLLFCFIVVINSMINRNLTNNGSLLANFLPNNCATFP
jgi:hypothetical protein